MIFLLPVPVLRLLPFLPSTCMCYTYRTNMLEQNNTSLITSAITTVPSSLSAAASDSSIPIPRTLQPVSLNDSRYLDNEVLFCDWTRSTVHCKEAYITNRVLLSSLILHLLVALFGLWLMIYRNEGFNKKMWTGLFSMVGSGIQPNPVRMLLISQGRKMP